MSRLSLTLFDLHLFESLSDLLPLFFEPLAFLAFHLFLLFHLLLLRFNQLQPARLPHYHGQLFVIPNEILGINAVLIESRHVHDDCARIKLTCYDLADLVPSVVADFLIL